MFHIHLKEGKEKELSAEENVLTFISIMNIIWYNFYNAIANIGINTAENS